MDGSAPAPAPVSAAASASESAPASGSASASAPLSASAPISAPARGRTTGPNGEGPRHSLRAWAELLRISAPASVPGDLLAGAAAAGLRPNARTALAACSSLCLYEAGMALNDWADRDIDALERPHRPIPSGRITPGAALAAAGGLTAASLACAAAAGRPALATATALAATVWAYDLHLKNTPLGPTAMACARALDLLQGAVATTGRGDGTSASTGAGTAASAAAGAGAGAPPHFASLRTAPTPRPHTRAALRALPSAALLGAHTFTVTTVSRREAQGSSSSLPLLALAAVTALANAAAGRFPARPTPGGKTTRPPAQANTARRPTPTPATAFVPPLLAAGYAATAARPLLVAALNPSPHFLQRAVGGGIRAMIPLQAALAARAGAPATGAAVLALIPVARRLSRKVSPT
ncbi:SCO3242 family prenyltransferase [Streptomyces sp. NPDC053542]|uniref:SCO3242 family prenyltransferase n=1 Tax=Streptomyces sp. NPDC053542 TaxID=3365710 RepID=UPI0037D20624